MLSRFRFSCSCCFGLLALAGLAGCVERRLVIISDPYGAIVYDEKNHPIGAAPVDHPFTYYGIYRFRLAKDGYETQVIEEKIRAPWYEWPVLDFISENLLPFTIRDVRYIRPTLQPVKVIPPEVLLQQGQALRDYGQTVGIPLPPPANPPFVGPPPAKVSPTEPPPFIGPPPSKASPAPFIGPPPGKAPPANPPSAGPPTGNAPPANLPSVGPPTGKAPPGNLPPQLMPPALPQ